MSFTYSDTPDSKIGDAVRFLIGDTSPTASKNVSDGELLYIVKRYGFATIADAYSASGDQTKIIRMAIEAGEALAAKYAKEANYNVGPISEGANMKTQETRQIVNRLKGRLAAGACPVVLGRSISQKDALTADTDAVQPAFSRTTMDNQVLDIGVSGGDPNSLTGH